MGIFGGLRREQASPEVAPERSAESFKGYLERAGLTLDSLTAGPAIEQMLGYYRSVRAANCPLEQDGDMLLFECGVGEWSTPPTFRFDLTRQFIRSGATGDDDISQLHLVLHYSPSARLSGSGASRWCTTPDDLPQFERFIRSSDAYAAVGGLTPDRVELYWEGV